MIPIILQKIVVVALLAVLAFNLTQRKHLSHGEEKRFATLYAGGFLLFFYGCTFVFNRFGIPAAYLAAVAAAELGVAFLIRDRLILFHTRCTSCGRRLTLGRILYVDAPFCEPCEAEIEAAALSTLGSPAGRAVEIPARVEEVDWDAWVPKETAVLCFIRDGDRVMLIDKKRGLGAGKVNAPGGRVEPDELPSEAAVRETQEEIYLTPKAPSQRGELSFIFADGYSLKCFVFVAEGYSGAPGETAEARPFWCPVDEIPYQRMWSDDRFWLPRVLGGDYVIGRFIFDGDRMLSQEILAG